MSKDKAKKYSPGVDAPGEFSPVFSATRQVLVIFTGQRNDYLIKKTRGVHYLLTRPRLTVK